MGAMEDDEEEDDWTVDSPEVHDGLSVLAAAVVLLVVALWLLVMFAMAVWS